MSITNEKRLTAEIRRLLLGRPQHRRNGKVARLPEATRERINRMIEDGMTYRAILEKLSQSTDAPLPHSISENNLSSWRLGGYRDWCREQERKELAAASRAVALKALAKVLSFAPVASENSAPALEAQGSAPILTKPELSEPVKG